MEKYKKANQQQKEAQKHRNHRHHYQKRNYPHDTMMTDNHSSSFTLWLPTSQHSKYTFPISSFMEKEFDATAFVTKYRTQVDSWQTLQIECTELLSFLHEQTISLIHQDYQSFIEFSAHLNQMSHQVDNVHIPLNSIQQPLHVFHSSVERVLHSIRNKCHVISRAQLKKHIASTLLHCHHVLQQVIDCFNHDLNKSNNNNDPYHVVVNHNNNNSEQQQEEEQQQQCIRVATQLQYLDQLLNNHVNQCMQSLFTSSTSTTTTPSDNITNNNNNNNNNNNMNQQQQQQQDEKNHHLNVLKSMHEQCLTLFQSIDDQFMNFLASKFESMTQQYTTSNNTSKINKTTSSSSSSLIQFMNCIISCYHIMNRYHSHLIQHIEQYWLNALCDSLFSSYKSSSSSSSSTASSSSSSLLYDRMLLLLTDRSKWYMIIVECGQYEHILFSLLLPRLVRELSALKHLYECRDRIKFHEQYHEQTMFFQKWKQAYSTTASSSDGDNNNNNNNSSGTNNSEWSYESKFDQMIQPLNQKWNFQVYFKLLKQHLCRLFVQQFIMDWSSLSSSNQQQQQQLKQSFVSHTVSNKTNHEDESEEDDDDDEFVDANENHNMATGSSSSNSNNTVKHSITYRFKYTIFHQFNQFIMNQLFHKQVFIDQLMSSFMELFIVLLNQFNQHIQSQLFVIVPLSASSSSASMDMNIHLCHTFCDIQLLYFKLKHYLPIRINDELLSTYHKKNDSLKQLVSQLLENLLNDRLIGSGSVSALLAPTTSPTTTPLSIQHIVQRHLIQSVSQQCIEGLKNLGSITTAMRSNNNAAPSNYVPVLLKQLITFVRKTQNEVQATRRVRHIIDFNDTHKDTITLLPWSVVSSWIREILNQLCEAYWLKALDHLRTMQKTQATMLRLKLKNSSVTTDSVDKELNEMIDRMIDQIHVDVRELNNIVASSFLAPDESQTICQFLQNCSSFQRLLNFTRLDL